MAWRMAPGYISWQKGAPMRAAEAHFLGVVLKVGIVFILRNTKKRTLTGGSSSSLSFQNGTAKKTLRWEQGSSDGVQNRLALFARETIAGKAGEEHLVGKEALAERYRKWSAAKEPSMEATRSLVMFTWLLTEEQELVVQKGVQKLLSTKVDGMASQPKKRQLAQKQGSSSSKRRKTVELPESADRFFA